MRSVTTKYAIIQAYGQQFKVKEGDKIQANFVDCEAGTKLTLSDVFLVSEAGKVTIGQPTVANAKVSATVTGHTRGEKILVFKYLRKNKHKKLQGHKQPYSILSIDKIEV
jgi:large subunit ribosomal protein L21